MPGITNGWAGDSPKHGRADLDNTPLHPAALTSRRARRGPCPCDLAINCARSTQRTAWPSLGRGLARFRPHALA